MAKKKTTKKSSNKKTLAGTALAGVAAAAAGYYFYGPRGKQHRKKIKSWSLKAHAEVMDQIDRVKEVDRDTFENIVDRVSKKYKKVRGVAASEVASFARDVKKQWNHIEREFKQGAKKGKQAVKKTAQKTTKQKDKRVTKKKS